ncbi:unnamed protein product [Fraxinus pennsylvanica]|uniref:Uncharacterized protein n=1 Tax=Fraxinus pennsylvanica TaxID=56036 RepID=A0AAD2ECD9_9LAMI|nr:unnamed protein product [Fraxinus pennsylvanica]
MKVSNVSAIFFHHDCTVFVAFAPTVLSNDYGLVGVVVVILDVLTWTFAVPIGQGSTSTSSDTFYLLSRKVPNSPDARLLNPSLSHLTNKSKLRRPCFSRVRSQMNPRATSQSFRDDQGNSASLVDSNLSILKYRMEQVRTRERLNACYLHGNGWNYNSGYNSKIKRQEMLLQSIELLGIVSSSIGLVFLSGSLFIFLVSLCF